MTVLGIQVPAATLAQLPEAARAPFEAEMKKPHTSTSCVTAEDIADLNFGKADEDEDCRIAQRTTTRTSATVTRVCAGDEKRTDTMVIEASSPETFKATIKMMTGGEASTMTMTGKWIAAVCKDE
jgi:hypothetical protein